MATPRKMNQERALRARTLYAQGWKTREIALELGVGLRLVERTLARSRQATTQSQKIFEMHEMMLEMTVLLRQLSRLAPSDVRDRMRGLKLQFEEPRTEAAAQ